MVETKPTEIHLEGTIQTVEVWEDWLLDRTPVYHGWEATLNATNLMNRNYRYSMTRRGVTAAEAEGALLAAMLKEGLYL